MLVINGSSEMDRELYDEYTDYTLCRILRCTPSQLEMEDDLKLQRFMIFMQADVQYEKNIARKNELRKNNTKFI